jgi:hypothetical protein
VTRHELHGLSHARAAPTALRPTAHLVPDAVNGDPMIFLDHNSSAGNRPASRQCRNQTARQARNSANRTIPWIDQKSNYP